MALAIYREVLTARQHWADSTSTYTIARLSAAEWVLFDDTPQNPPAPGDPLDLAVSALVPGPSVTAEALRAAPLFPPR